MPTLPTLTKADTLDRYTLRSLGRTPFAIEYDDDGGEYRGDPVPCTECGIPLATEADMARHFVLPDAQYRNLGLCPVKSAAAVLGVPCPVRPSRDPLVSLVKHTYDYSDPAPDAWRYPEHTDGCDGCANDGYALRDRATALWLARAVSIVDVAYTAFHAGTTPADRAADRHVTVYSIDRAYGGPEEGGWYFDTGSVEWTYQAGSHAAADVIASTLCAVLWPVDTGDQYNVNYCGGEYSVRVDDAPGSDYPLERPHYE